MKFVACTYEAHADAVLDIMNDVIATSTAVYDYAPRTPASMVAWFKDKSAARFPVIGAEDKDGTLLGFATYGVFRRWPAYKYSVEHSVYVRRDHRHEGIGIALMRRLIDAAKEQNYHTMIAVIDSENEVSIALHKKLGFVHAGTVRQAGYKFGHWLDVSFYQLTFETPEQPVEG